MALCQRYGRSGNRLSRFESEEEVLLRRFAARYASRRQPTKIGLWREMKAVIDRLNRMRVHAGLRRLECPSRIALSHAIDALDQFHVFAGREGVEKAKRHFAIVNRGLEVERPLERVEADEWRLPLQSILTRVGIWRELKHSEREAVETSRLWLSTVIDVRTKVVLAMRLIRTCTGADAVATLRMAVTDKSSYAEAAGCRTAWDMSGRPETVATDNGSSYISDAFHGSVLDLGAEYLHPQAGVPRMRGTQERLYRTLHEQFVTMFDGRSFRDVVQKGDYDSEANAVLDTTLLGKLLVRFVVDVYHNSPHRGLGGQTPRNAWLELRRRYGVRPGPTKSECAAIFGTVIERRIANDGLHVMGLRYQSLALQRMRKGKLVSYVRLKVDPADLGSVFAFDGEAWHPVPCMRSGMNGVTLEQWVLAATAARRRYADEAAFSEPVVLEALRHVRAAAEGARRRAGIASPVLSSVDYDRLEKKFFVAFDRADAENVDLLAAEHETEGSTSVVVVPTPLEGSPSAAGPVSTSSDAEDPDHDAEHALRGTELDLDAILGGSLALENPDEPEAVEGADTDGFLYGLED